MNRAETLIRTHFPQSSGELVIGGLPISDIVFKTGTPVYIYDQSIIGTNFKSIRKKLSPNVNIFYSIKANPCPTVVSFFRTLGAGVEIGSIGEFQTVRQCGFDHDSIIFAGPGKSTAELQESLSFPILSINVESFQEIERIRELATANNVKARVSVRINPCRNVSGSHQKMGGVPSPFGIDEERAQEAIGLLTADPERIQFMGIHIYVGNQIFEYELALHNIQNTLRIASEIKQSCNLEVIPYINFGGGLGIPYYQTDKPFDFESFAIGLNQILGETKDKFPKTQFIMELGRYLVAQSGVFLTRVLYTKVSRNQKFIIVDGGMNCCSIGTGNLGQKVKRKFPLCVANRLNEACSGSAAIVGPLCTPMDSYGSDFQVPDIQPGDIVAVLNVGAYGFSTSPHGFLSHPVCSEAFVGNGSIQIIRNMSKKDVEVCV